MPIVENWTQIEGFPGYSVNPLGQVRNDSTERLLRIRINQYDVPYVGMMKDYRQHIRSLPRLVAETYIPRPNEVFDTPINKNGHRDDCSADNLEWRPRWYAVYYRNQFKERYPNPINVPILNVDTGEIFPDSLTAGCHYGVLEREVVLSILNRTPAWPTYQTFELAEMM